eukprot:1501396-Pyramimonas_sp.AAC.1
MVRHQAGRSALLLPSDAHRLIHAAGVCGTKGIPQSHWPTHDPQDLIFEFWGSLRGPSGDDAAPVRHPSWPRCGTKPGVVRA